MVDLALRIDVLPWPHNHSLSRGHVDERRLSWVCVRNPYRDGETVCGAAKVDRYCAGDVEEEGRGAIGECVHICPRRQRWILGQGLGDVVVCAVDIVVFTCQDAVQPVEDMTLDNHCRLYGIVSSCRQAAS